MHGRSGECIQNATIKCNRKISELKVCDRPSDKGDNCEVGRVSLNADYIREPLLNRAYHYSDMNYTQYLKLKVISVWTSPE